MDPNEALNSILHGHMIFDHAEALSGWLRSGGFAPEEQLMPADKHEFFAAHCARVYGSASGIGIRVTADTRGIWTHSVVSNDKELAASWDQLSKLEDSGDY